MLKLITHCVRQHHAAEQLRQEIDDAQPLMPEWPAGMKRTPRVRIIRRALGLSQEESDARFHIPIGALRD